MDRRHCLALLGVSVAALAGCLGDDDDGDDGEDDGDEGGAPSPQALAEKLTERIDNEDVDGVNYLIHEDSEEEWDAEDANFYQGVDVELKETDIDRDGNTAEVLIIHSVGDEYDPDVLLVFEFRERDSEWWVWKRLK
jgi:hypothetical protein